MIPDEIIEQVRDSVDLIALIGETVDLKKSGGDWRGPCPFHGGQHRNFAVIPKKGRYYCFVCKESGDAFSWYMKHFGMDYPGAVREVARRMGIVIPEARERQGPDPREPLYQAVAVAHDWFARQLRELPEAEEARRYLQGRGLDLDTVGPFELGYAPRSVLFAPAMSQLGLSEAVMLEAGLLAKRDDGRVVPRFRGRLLFPIHDLRGRVVGFGGRLLGDGEPKYLNSPESPVFHKGQTLYNLHLAKNHIRKEGTVILVEGYFDVLRLVLAGLEHVVAPLGTALTGDQAALLKRFSPTATLLLDSDTAGLKATFRAGDELLRHEVRVKVATMPPGEDPDTLVRTGGLAAVERVLADAVDVMERKIQILDRRGWFSDIEHRREALDRLLPTIRATKDPIQRELYLGLVAERSGVGKAVLEQEVNSASSLARLAPRATRPTEAPASRPAEPTRADGARAELVLLQLMVANGEWRTRCREGILPEWFEEPGRRELFEAVVAVAGDGPAVPPEGTPPKLAERWARMLAEPLPATGQEDRLFNDASRRLERRPKQRECDALLAQIRTASDAERGALMARHVKMVRDLRDEYPELSSAKGFNRGQRSRSARS